MMVNLECLARSYVWWPRIDKEIDSVVKACFECQETRHSPSVAPLHPWEWPHCPWAHVHIDYAGPVEGKMLLVAVDAQSKWIDVAVVTSATSSVTIEKLRGCSLLMASQMSLSLTMELSLQVTNLKHS